MSYSSLKLGSTENPRHQRGPSCPGAAVLVSEVLGYKNHSRRFMSFLCPQSFTSMERGKGGEIYLVLYMFIFENLK